MPAVREAVRAVAAPPRDRAGRQVRRRGAEDLSRARRAAREAKVAGRGRAAARAARRVAERAAERMAAAVAPELKLEPAQTVARRPADPVTPGTEAEARATRAAATRATATPARAGTQATLERLGLRAVPGA